MARQNPLKRPSRMSRSERVAMIVLAATALLALAAAFFRGTPGDEASREASARMADSLVTASRPTAVPRTAKSSRNDADSLHRRKSTKKKSEKAQRAADRQQPQGRRRDYVNEGL